MIKYIWTNSQSSPPVKFSLFFYFALCLVVHTYTHIHTHKLHLSYKSTQRVNSVWKQQFLSWINTVFFSFFVHCVCFCPQVETQWFFHPSQTRVTLLSHGRKPSHQPSEQRRRRRHLPVPGVELLRHYPQQRSQPAHCLWVLLYVQRDLHLASFII